MAESLEQLTERLHGIERLQRATDSARLAFCMASGWEYDKTVEGYDAMINKHGVRVSHWIEAFEWSYEKVQRENGN